MAVDKERNKEKQHLSNDKKKSSSKDIENNVTISKRREQEKQPPMSFTSLFRYSTSIDKSLISCGLLSALIQGSAMPLLVLVFGRMTDDFVAYSSCPNDSDSSQNNSNETSANFSFSTTTYPSDYRCQSLEDVMTLFAYYYITVGCVAFVCGFLQVHTMSLTSTRQTRKIRQQFFKSVIRQEMEWFDNHSCGELSSKLNEEVKKIGDAIGDKLAQFVNNISTVICGLTIGFINGWQLTLIVLSTAPLIGGACVLMDKFISSWADKEMQAYAKAGTIVENVLRNIRTVVAYGAENTEVQRYYQKLGEAEEQGVRKGLMFGLFQGFLWFLLFSTYALAFWYGSVLALDSAAEFSIGKLIIVFFTFVLATINFGHASTTFDTFMIGKTAAASVYQVIDKKSAIDPMSENGLSLDNFSGEIKFQNVHFHYTSRKQDKVLCNLSETFVPGKIHALVGQSGTGKSTVLKLIQRLYDPRNGEITLDGFNVKKYNVHGLRNIIGVVQQDPMLFSTTISENILLGSNNSETRDVIAAAKEANAYDFIMKLPEEFDTMVGVGGCQLSGGQKQRIAIARALIRNPKILLLDQPCSALDTQSETVILQNLKNKSQHRTTILVAHRQSTMKIADSVVKLEGNFCNDASSILKKNHSLLSLTVDNLWHINEKCETGSNTELLNTEKVKTCTNTLSDSDYESTTAEEGKDISVAHKNKPENDIRDISEANSNITSECKVIIKDNKDDDGDITIPPTSRILRMNLSEFPYIILGSIGALFNGAIQPLFAVLLSAIIGIHAVTDNIPKQDEINRYCIFMAVVAAISFASHFLQHYMFAKSGEKLTRKIRKDTFSAMLRQDISWFDKQESCSSLLSSRLSRDAGLIQGAAGVQIGVLVSILTSLVTALAIAFYSGWKLALVEIAFFPLIIGAYAIQGRMINANTLRHQKVIEAADQLVSDTLNSIETVAQFSHEEYFGKKYDSLLLETYKNGKKLSLTQATAFGFATSVLYFSYAATFRYGATIINEIGIESMFRVYFVIIFAGISLGKAYRYMPDYRKAKKSAGRVFEIMDRQPQLNTLNGPGISPDDFKGDIQLKECEFSYPARPNCSVLDSLSVSISRGQTLALVGISGCGKSTVVQLLERFYDTESGVILFDGEDIKKYNLSYLRSRIGVVFQEPVLFEGSVHDNIIYGCECQPTIQEVHDAAKVANIHDLIVRLEQAYDTQVGYKGNRFSKGERQRIAIARSLVRKPTVLLLDEATSSLDGENEKLVQDALECARKGRTSILIAHRLSTIRNADKIAVMSQGKITECGSHEELLEKKGAYFNMIKINSMQT